MVKERFHSNTIHLLLAHAVMAIKLKEKISNYTKRYNTKKYKNNPNTISIYIGKT
jgi:hypothetical protein